MANKIQLTPEVIEEVRKVIPTVQYIETVADFIGVDRTTFRRWIKLGGQESRRLANTPEALPDPRLALHYDLHRTYRKALADSAFLDLGSIRQAARDGQWKAAAWRLERRFPSKWGVTRREVVEMMREIAAMRKELAVLLAQRETY